MKKILQKFLYKLISIFASGDWLYFLIALVEIYLLYVAFFQVRACHAAPAQQNVTIGVNVGTGYGGVLSDNVYSYLEPAATTCQFGGTRQVVVPPSSTSFPIDTSLIFSGFAVPIAFGLADTTESPGQKLNVGMSVGGPRMHMAARGFIYSRTNGGFPVFYVDNPSLTQPAVVQVFMLGN